MNRIVTVVALALTWIAVDCSAAPPEGAREKGARGKGPRESGQRGGERMQQRGGDPAQMVARMMQAFDKDGDQKLDVKELTALLTSMRERRAGGGGGARPGQPGGRQAGEGQGMMRRRPGGDSKRKLGDNENNRPGGERPKRPAAE